MTMVTVITLNNVMVMTALVVLVKGFVSICG